MRKLDSIKALLIALFCFSSVNAQQLTLERAVSVALRNNAKLKQYDAKLEQKEFDNYSAWGNFLPSISFDARYTHLNDPLQIDLAPIRDVIILSNVETQGALYNLTNIVNGNPPLSQTVLDAYKKGVRGQLNSMLPEFKSTLKEQNYWTATWTAVQPLFVGGKLIAAKKYATAEEKAAAIERERVANEIITEVVVNYSRVELLKELVGLRERVLDGMQLHMKDAQKLFDEGVIANYHLLRAKVAVAEAERNLTTDENNLELAKLALATTLGKDNYSSLRVTDGMKFNETILQLDDMVQISRVNQPILRLIEQKKEAAAQGYNVALSELFPKIAAFGKYEMVPQDLSAMEPRWAIGIQAQFKIFNGLKDFLNLQKAERVEEEVEFIRIDTERKINLWLNKAYKEVDTYSTQYKKLEATQDLAKENLRMNEKRFKSGIGTSLEVIDARLSFEKVEVERLNSLFNYYSSLANLYLAAGKPDEVLKIWNK